jgi:RNA polymerase sigma factor (sigma-70 family)
MTIDRATFLLQHLRRLVGVATTDPLPDRALLHRFAALRDRTAFEAVLRRHGPMVLRLCERLLPREHDVEDVFQATFLVLAQKAASPFWHESVGGWLHEVACRLALKAKADARRHLRLDCREAVRDVPDPLTEASAREQFALLDAELAQLPERFRAPLVLCCLEGRTRDEAAFQLGWSVSTVRRRLGRGLELLRLRLARRGVTVPAALGATLFRQDALAVLPSPLRTSTIDMVLGRAAGKSLEGTASARAAALAAGVLPPAGGVPMKAAAVLLLLLGMLAGAGALAARLAPAPMHPGPDEAGPGLPARGAGRPAPGEGEKVRLDIHGDPLPPGAVARVGTIRLRPGDALSALAFSPDGKTLASGHWGHGIQVWETATGKELRRFGEFPASVNALTFAPDGRRLASSAGADKAVRLWDAGTGKELGAFLGHGGDVQCVAFSPDGTRLASGSSDQTVRLWDPTTGKELQRFNQEDRVWSLSWSPDGRTLAAGGQGGPVRLWETATGKLLRRLNGHRRVVGRLAWAPGGKTLASGGSDGTVRLWDPGTGQVLHTLGLEDGQRKQALTKEAATTKAPEGTAGSLGWCHGLAFTRDGKTVYAAGQDYRTIFAFDVATGRERPGLAGTQRVFCLTASADGKLLAVGGADGRIDLWDLAGKKLLHDFGGPLGRAFSVAFSPDGKVLATAGDDPAIRLWEVGTWRERARLRRDHYGFVTRLTFSPDGKFLAECGQDHEVRVWDVAAGKAVHLFEDPNVGTTIFSVAFSPDGKLLAAAFRGATVWDLATGKEVHHFDGRDGGPKEAHAVAFSPDGRALALVGAEAVYLCEPRTGKILGRFNGIAGGIGAVAFSADGRTLAAAGEDSKVRLWEVATGKERAVFAGHTIAIHAVAFSPDGRLLASASGSFRDHGDDTVRLWDLAAGKELRRFDGHRNVVTSVAFAPDGKTLASASEDSTVLVWEAAAPRRPARANLTPVALDALWADLADADAARAYRAVWALAATPAQSVPLMRERLKPAAAVDPRRVTRLLADLDSKQFEVRGKAEAELAELAEQAGPALRKALEGKPPAEVRRRLERLLAKLEGPLPAPVRQREVRAVEVLEAVGTVEARRLLKELSRGVPEARLTREALGSLDRLARTKPGG